jgi:hypothetical protein
VYGRVPDNPTATIILKAEWNESDERVAEDGANGSRSAFRELFN